MKYTPNNFTLPQIVVVNETSEVWALSWYYTDELGIRVRFRKTFGINRIKNKRMRRREFERKAAEIYGRMCAGKHPLTDGSTAAGVCVDANLKEAIVLALKLVAATIKHAKTVSNYNSYCKRFLIWAEKAKLLALPVSGFTGAAAQRFLDYLLVDRKYSTTTYNNYKQFMHAVFERLKKRGYIAKNVWADTENKKDAQTKFGPYTPDEKLRIIRYIKESNPALLLPVQLIYYCLFRPVELCRLQVKHFDLKNKKICLPAGTVVKKNMIEIVKAIPDVFLPDLRVCLHGLDRETYLFGDRHLKPGMKPVVVQRIQEHYRAVLVALRINTKNRRLYSWKDTAVCDLIDNGTDIANIQQQAGHERSEQTIHYARLRASGPRESLNQGYNEI